jgi:hypothetical protein
METTTANMGFGVDKITGWLRDNGGNCDCEVLANVEEKFDENAVYLNHF